MARLLLFKAAYFFGLFACGAFGSSGYGGGGGWDDGYRRRVPKDVMVNVINDLGLALLEVHNEHNENNIAISPYGATSVLVALVEGLRGDAAHEIKYAIRLPQELSIVRIGLRDIHRHLKSYFIPKEGFLAGLTLSHENITLNREYESILRFYGYDVDSFNNPVYPEPFSTTPIPTTSPKTTTVTETITTTEEMARMETDETTETTIASTENLNSLKPERTTRKDTTLPDLEYESTGTTKNVPVRETMAVSTITSEEDIVVSETRYTTPMNLITTSMKELTTVIERSDGEDSTSNQTDQEKTTTESEDTSTTVQAVTTKEEGKTTVEKLSSLKEMPTLQESETTTSLQEGTSVKSTDERTTLIQESATVKSNGERTTPLQESTSVKSTDQATTLIQEGTSVKSNDERTTENTNDESTVSIKDDSTTTQQITIEDMDGSVEEPLVTITEADSAETSTTENKEGNAGTTTETKETKAETTTEDKEGGAGTSTESKDGKTGATTESINEDAGRTTESLEGKAGTTTGSINEGATTASKDGKTETTTENEEGKAGTTIEDNSSTTESKLASGTTLQETTTDENLSTTTQMTSAVSKDKREEKPSTTSQETTLEQIKEAGSINTMLTTETLYSTTTFSNEVILTGGNTATTLASVKETPGINALPLVATLTTPKAEVDENSSKDSLMENSIKDSGINALPFVATLTTSKADVNETSTEDLLSTATEMFSSTVSSSEETTFATTVRELMKRNARPGFPFQVHRNSVSNLEEEDVYGMLKISGNISSSPYDKQDQPARKRRSVIDYLIARYYDNYYISGSGGRRYLPPPPPPAKPHHNNYQPEPPYTFLVNGKHRESNISFMTYDTVLPFYYVPGLDAMALSFPLDSNMYYLLLVLPVDEQGIDKLVRDFRKVTTLERIVQNLKYTHVKAVIPSFTLKGYVVLTPSLQKLCIKKIFEPRHADFSQLTPEKDIYVTNIEQAVTVTIRNYVDPSNGSGRNLQAYRPVEFRADHPFLYFVMDSQIHVNLMAGKIINPLNSRIR